MRSKHLILEELWALFCCFKNPESDWVNESDDGIWLRDLLKKYITILESASWVPPMSENNTSKIPRLLHRLSMYEVCNQVKHEKPNKPVAAAIEIIDLDLEDKIGNDCNDDSNIDKVHTLKVAKVLSDSRVHSVDISFERTVQNGKKKRKSETSSPPLDKKIKSIKVKSEKQETLVCTNNSKEILKKPDGQNNFTDMKTIDIKSSVKMEIISEYPGSNYEKYKKSDCHASQKLELNYNKTIKLINDNFDREVELDKKPVSLVPPFHPKEHLQVTVSNICPQTSSGRRKVFFSNVTPNQPMPKEQNFKNDKLIKTEKKPDKNSLFKKLSRTVIFGSKNKHKKHKKVLFNEWRQPTHYHDSSDEEVVLDKKPVRNIISQDFPVPPFNPKKHLQVAQKNICPQTSSGRRKVFFPIVTANQPMSMNQKFKNDKLIKTTKKEDTNSLFKKCKHLSSAVIAVKNKKKIGGEKNHNKHKKEPFKEWTRPAHLSSTSTKTSTVVNSTCSAQRVGTNIYNPNKNKVITEGLRPIVIDGSSVAFSYVRGDFSLRRLQICIDYFLQRGHRQIKAFVPRFRMNKYNHDELNRMEKKGTLILTPSRRVNGKMIVPYDGRFIIQYATEVGGVVVSLHNYRHLVNENRSWKETVDRRLLMFTWVEDILMFPQNPLGRYGPTLDEFLRY